MPEFHSNAPSGAGKPAKPYPDYPLFPHATGRWAKKIRGKLHYFGPWGDPQGALDRYLAVKDDLHAGRTPRKVSAGVTVKDVANTFLNAKQEAVAAGEMTLRTWNDYRTIIDKMVTGLGKQKPVEALDPQDFSGLKNNLAKHNGPARMSTIVQVIRCAFKFAYESGMIDRPMRFGPVFRRTSKKTLRLHRAKQGPKLFTPEEIHRMLSAAGLQLRAMVLLGINCGYGNQDCAALSQSALDLDRGWATYPRPKTGIPRRCKLWPETVQALREVLAHRPEPKDPGGAGLVFITKYGLPWAKAENAGPLTQETKKLLDKLGINGRNRLGFYSLRHTHHTVSDEARDQPAADYIMGHESPHMSSHYRETISDARLAAVAEHVRSWLFGASDKAGEEE